MVFSEILQNSQESTCARVYFLIKLQADVCKLTLLKKRLAQVFSCEFCKISKNTFFIEHLRVTASVLSSTEAVTYAMTSFSDGLPSSVEKLFSLKIKLENKKKVNICKRSLPIIFHVYLLH